MDWIAKARVNKPFPVKFIACLIVILISVLVGLRCSMIVDRMNPETATKVRLNTLKSALCTYRETCEAFPESAEGVHAMTWQADVIGGSPGPCQNAAIAVEKFRAVPDGWGNPLIVIYSRSTPILRSLGSDSEVGGTGSAEDIDEEVVCNEMK